MDSSHVSTPGHDAHNRSGRMYPNHQQQYEHFSPTSLNGALDGFSGKLSVDTTARPAFWERDRGRRASCENEL